MGLIWARKKAEENMSNGLTSAYGDAGQCSPKGASGDEKRLLQHFPDRYSMAPYRAADASSSPHWASTNSTARGFRRHSLRGKKRLPVGFPRWKTVYHHFRRWTLDGTLELLNQALRAVARAAQGKRTRPTAAIIDSQTVRSDPHGGEVAYDAAKKTKGRKRFLCVDTLGLVLDVVLLPADTPEREGAKVLLEPILQEHPWLRKIWADGGFSGPEFAQWVKERRPKVDVEVVRRCDDVSGFQVLPRRWVIERTFGWLCQHRRLVRDYEKTTSSARAWILVAMTRIMLRRLA